MERVFRMSAISHHYEKGLAVDLPNPLHKLARFVKGFFTMDGASRPGRLYHGHFNYGLVPDTAINDFNSMGEITSLHSGDCFVYVFERSHYQGDYRIIGPGETADVEHCGSLIASIRPISIEAVRKNTRAPEHCWEMTGPKYLIHFYAAYRYV